MFKFIARVSNYNRLKNYLKDKQSIDLFVYGNQFGKSRDNNLVLIKENITNKQQLTNETKENKIKSIYLASDQRQDYINSIISLPIINNNNNGLLKRIKEIEINNNNNNNNNNTIHLFTESEYFKNQFDKIPSSIDNNNIFFLKKHPKEFDNFEIECSNCGKFKMELLKEDKSCLKCYKCKTILKKEINQILVYQKRAEFLITSIMNKNRLTVFYKTAPFFETTCYEFKEFFKEFSLYILLFPIIAFGILFLDSQ